MKPPISTAEEALHAVLSFRAELKKRGEVAAANVAERCAGIIRSRMRAPRPKETPK